MTDTLARIEHALAVHDSTPVPSPDWMPGDPLHDPGIDSVGCIRPMFDLLEEHTRTPRCVPCDVSWVGPEPCWLCGEDTPERMTELRDHVRQMALGGAAPHPRQPTMPSLPVMVECDGTPFIEAMTLMRRALDRVTPRLHAAFARLGKPQPEPSHPGPPKLCVDGHAYRRRTRSRRGRRT